jgi:hypothetical protein
LTEATDLAGAAREIRVAFQLERAVSELLDAGSAADNQGGQEGCEVSHASPDRRSAPSVTGVPERGHCLEHRQIELVRNVTQVSVASVTVHEPELARSWSMQVWPTPVQMVLQFRDWKELRPKRQVVAVSSHNTYPLVEP